MPSNRRILVAALAALLPMLLAGCGGPEEASEDRVEDRVSERGSGRSGVDAEAESRVDGDLLVSAAASLTDAFTAMESAFEAAHPAVDVALNLAGSSRLRVQILEGAPVDVFASADRSNMTEVMEAGEVGGEPVVFARNRLQIAVPRGNPAGVSGLGDFAEEENLIGLCAEAVPCGAFARRALSRAGVAPSIDTNEPDVRALLTKIELGEIDAGITYATDIASADGAVEGIEIPEETNVVAEYPIAVLDRAPNPKAADAFVDFVLSVEGQEILAAFGFQRR